MKQIDLGEPTSFLGHVYLGCTQRECHTSKDIVDNYRSMNPESLLEQKKIYQAQGNLTRTWSFDMKGHAKNVWSDIASWQTEQPSNCTKSQRHAWMTIKEVNESVGELSPGCSQIVLKCLYLARIGRPDILWSVNKLARAITQWTRAWDKRLARLISYIHRTCEFKQYCHVENTEQQCRLGLFQDSDFGGDLEDSKSTSGRILCILGSLTFVPTSWMCKKQTSVSHSSTEAEIISLDAGLRMDGIPALDLWDLVIEVFHSSPNQLNNTKDQVQGNLSRDTTSDKHTKNKTKVPTQHDNFDLNSVVYCVPSNAKFSRLGAMLYIFEGNEAVIKKPKSNNETCVQNPQSCSWLVVWQK